MKPIEFLGDSLAQVREFPDEARRLAGHQMDRVQRGLEPDDWKPMTTVGPGVREIRVRDGSGAFRNIYLATIRDRVLILHAFRKTTERTPQRDLALAAARLRNATLG